MPPVPKRHHQVPQFYLERFADRGKLAVRWRDGNEYTTGPTNVAVESGFYDIPDGMAASRKKLRTAWRTSKG